MNSTREGIFKKITFELRQKGGRVVGPAQILEPSTLGRSKTRNKEVGTSTVSSRGRQKASMALGFCSNAIEGQGRP